MLENGVWRTVAGRRIFIKEGQSLTDAMKESGKFKNKNKNKYEDIIKKYGDLSDPDNYMKAQNELVFKYNLSVKESEKILGKFKAKGFKTQEQLMRENGIKFATEEHTRQLQARLKKIIKNSKK